MRRGLRPILVLLLLASASPSHLAPENGPAGSGRIRIATWNLEWLNRREGAGEVPRRGSDYAALAREARRLDADVVALQEVDGEAAARRVFDPAVYTFHFTGDPRNPQRTGFAVRRSLVFEALPDLTALAIDGTRRGADIALRWGDRSVRLLSIHLKSGCWGDALDRPTDACTILSGQLPALEAWIDARARDRAPFLVLGDFNRRFLPRDPFWAALDDGEPPGAVLTDAAGYRTSRCAEGLPRMFIDHILAGGDAAGWLIRDSFAEHRYHPAERRAGAVLSDHCPLSVLIDPRPGRVAPPPESPPVLRVDQAAGHLGEIATVCGVVASANHLSRSARKPTFLNLDRPYPEHLFTVVIWGKDRAAFGRPEATLPGRRICVTGLVELHKGRPEIVASVPEQLEIGN